MNLVDCFDEFAVKSTAGEEEARKRHANGLHKRKPGISASRVLIFIAFLFILVAGLFWVFFQLHPF